MTWIRTDSGMAIIEATILPVLWIWHCLDWKINMISIIIGFQQKTINYMCNMSFIIEVSISESPRFCSQQNASQCLWRTVNSWISIEYFHRICTFICWRIQFSE
jgi:hypothetical protein